MTRVIHHVIGQARDARAPLPARAARREAGHLAPASAGSSRARAAPPCLRWLQKDGKAARPRSIVATPTPGRLLTPSRPRAGLGPRCRRVARWVERGWPTRLLTGPGKAAGRAPGQRTSPGTPAAGGWTPLSKPASDLRGEASQRLRSQHTGAGRAFGVVLTRKLLTNFIYIHRSMTDQRRDPGAGTCHGTPRGISPRRLEEPESCERQRRGLGARRRLQEPGRDPTDTRARSAAAFLGPPCYACSRRGANRLLAQLFQYRVCPSLSSFSPSLVLRRGRLFSG